MALRDSAGTAASCRGAGGGVIPARISSWKTSVACKQPEIVQRTMLSISSNF